MQHCIIKTRGEKDRKVSQRTTHGKAKAVASQRALK